MTGDPVQIEGYRISAAQKRLWHLAAREGTSRTSVAHVPISATLDAGSLQTAVDALVSRHEIFRTVFHRLPGMDVPLQVRLDHARCDVQAHDWRGHDDIDIDASIAKLRAEASRRSLAPARESLLEVHAASLTDERQLLILVAPALIADRIGLELAIDELRADDAAVPQLQYVQYSEWLHEGGATEDGEAGARHWANLAAGTNDAGVLPFQCEAIPPADEEAVTVVLPPSPELARRLAASAARFNVREEALLLAAAATAIRIRTRADAVRMDVESSGRRFDELERAPGPYDEYLPLRVSFDDGASVAAIARTIDASLRENEAQQPFFDRELCDRRDAQRLPIGFRFRKPERQAESDSDAERFVLLFEAVRSEATLELRASYSPARHQGETIARTLDSWALALASLDIKAPADSLQLLGDEELRVLAALNATAMPFSRDGATLDALFAATAAERGDAPAVCFEEKQLSFAELDQLANRIANALHACGAGRGARVCVIATRSIEQIAAVLGVWKAGAAYAAIDPGNPPARQTTLVDAIGATVVLTNTAAMPALARFTIPVMDVDSDQIRLASANPPESRVTSRDAAYIIFTSGTTGIPKGVLVEHRSAVNLACALQAAVYEGATGGLRVSVNAPLTFDSSVKQLVQMVNGHCLCVVPEDIRTDGELLMGWLRRSRVDVFDCTPSHIRILYAAGLGETRDLHLRHVLVGGERIDRELWDQLAAHPSIRFHNAYGPTETTVNVSVEPITAGMRPALGWALPNVRVHILDADQRPVPFGVPAEICIAGAGVSRGYHGRPSLTAEKFVPEPGVPGSRMYRSGDRGRFLADGRIEFLGRTDDQVKIRGFRIEPAEIEALLALNAHVGRAVVAPRATAEGDLRLVAYVSRRETPAIHDDAGPLARLPIGIEVAQINPNETAYLYEEIFAKRTYIRHSVLLRDDSVVFDVGANIGMFTLFVSRECANPRIWAFEPIAPIWEKLEWNARHHGRHVKVCPFGLSSGEREETFTFYPGYSMMSSQQAYADAASEHEVIRRYLHNEQQQGMQSRDLLLDHIDELLEHRFRAEPVTARLRRLSDVIREEGVSSIDLLKIDVQRAEMDVLLGIDDEHWPRIQQVVMEVHDAAGSPTQGRTGDLLDLLERRGFDVVIEQDPLLQGTDRYNLYAVRATYVAEHARAAASAQQTRDPLSTAALRAFLLDHLPEQIVPSAFVVMDALPLNRHGKIDRAALPAPGATRPDVEHEAITPQNWQEEALVEIWQQILGLKSVGVTDNFFQLGGDSIRSIQVQALAQKRGLRVSLQKLFVFQTIRELVRGTDLADLPAPAAETARPLALPEGIEDAYPLASLQEGMVYHSELTGDPRTYHNATTHRIELPLDLDKLLAAFHAVIAAHPILRTSFAILGHGRPLQLVHSTVTPSLPVTDLSAATSEERDSAIDAALERELSTPFDFARPPLLRLHAFRTEERAFELLLTEYHAVLDGWSRHLFLTELVRRYAHALGRAEAPAAPPTFGYRRFVELQQEAIRSEESLAFWRTLLDGARPSPLPVFESREPRVIRLQHVPLADGTTASLRAIARSEGVPLKSLLLAIYARAIAAISGCADPLVGVVMNVRPEEAEGDRILGLFLNTLPFPIRTGDASWTSMARRAFELEQRIVTHRFVPLDIVQRLAGGRPLLDAFFNFTHFYDVGASPAPMTTSRITPVDVAFRLAVDFEIDSASGELLTSFQYNASTLDDQFAADFSTALREAIDAASRDPHASATIDSSRTVAAREHVVDPTPSSSASVEPRTEVERRVAAIWRDVLRLERVGVTDPFAAVGGHSLLATQIVLRIREEMSCALPLSVLCENATVAGLARFLEEGPGRAT
jgi:amino acid adenylation domain-containing protein/FkbM family methyltransferase